MSKRKRHKKRPKQRTKTKGKETHIDNDLPKKHRLRGAISHALSSGWVQNSGVAFLLAFFALIAAIMTSTQVKAAAVTFALSGTLFLWLLAGAVIRNAKLSDEPDLAFSLLAKHFEVSKSPTQGMGFWYRYPTSYGDTLSPASAALYMTVKNPRTSTVYIERLEVDVQKEGKRWMSLRNIPTDGGRLYWIYDDITKASLLNMPTLEKRALSNISAGATVAGWTFWVVTDEYPAVEGDNLRWRIRAKDSGGDISEYLSPFEVVTSKPTSDTAMSQTVPIVFTGTREDLSKLIPRFYEPFPYK
jgi:hypothetical protein